MSDVRPYLVHVEDRSSRRVEYPPIKETSDVQ
jgi:hypothetical protein